jgi:hypothetical protein
VHERELALYLPPFFEPSRTNLVLMAVPARTPDAANGGANKP